MRFWLILLQLAIVCALVSLVGFAGELAVTSADEPAGVAVAKAFGVTAFILALDALLVFLYTGAMASAAAVSIATAVQPFLVIAAVCFACAVLAGYKRLWWLRWVGFIVNLGIGVFLIMVTVEDPSLPAGIASLYFLAQALMFFLLPQKGDAERIRKSATLLHPVLGAIGLSLGAFVFIHHKTGLVTILLTVLFYAVPFFLHYRVSRAVQLQPKVLIKAVAVLALTLLALIAFIVVRPILAGPLLLSWLSIPLYLETLVLFKVRADVPYIDWRQQLRKSIKLLIVLTLLAATLVGGMLLYEWRSTANLPTAKSLKSTEGLRALRKLNEEQSSRIILIPWNELPPFIAKAAKASSRGTPGEELRSLILRLTENSSYGAAERYLRKEMDRGLSDEEALSAFLAVAGYGRNAFGLTAAAETYYGKALGELNLCEAAMLVSQASFWRDSGEAENMKSEQRDLLRRMVRAGAISDNDMQTCINKNTE